jgi:hypothetical protein
MNCGSRWVCLVSAVLAVVAQPSAAQVANDNELYAAYCLKILTDGLDADEKLSAEIAKGEFPFPPI